MSNWIQIDQDELNLPSEEEIAGVLVTIYFSPYDVPEAVRGSYDRKRKLSTVDFRYLGGPEEVVQQRCGDVVFFVGKHSRRLQRIELLLHDINPEKVQVTVKTKLNEVIQHLVDVPSSGYPVALGNFKAASKAIGQKEDQLLQDLVGAE